MWAAIKREYGFTNLNQKGWARGEFQSLKIRKDSTLTSISTWWKEKSAMNYGRKILIRNRKYSVFTSKTTSGSWKLLESEGHLSRFEDTWKDHPGKTLTDKLKRIPELWQPERPKKKGRARKTQTLGLNTLPRNKTYWREPRKGRNREKSPIWNRSFKTIGGDP